MVAIVTGTGLGLERSSGFVLGSRGQLDQASLGRSNDNVYLNAATGNLILSRTDEILIGRGPDAALSQNYNSRGAMNDDNGDNWQLSAQKRATGLTGTVNTAGSTVTRIDWDGSDTIYSWDAMRSAYISKQGAGACDLLTFAANIWTWTDGNSRLIETYDHLNGGRILTSKDTDNNSLTYTYTGSALTKITTADGEYTTLTWSGNNLLYLTTSLSDGTALIRAYYTYDTSNRLTAVSVDLSPNDQSKADANIYSTTYTYDGTSKRIASIAETDGTLLQIAYDGSGRVASLAQTVENGVTRTTTISYGSNKTTIFDAYGQATVLDFDAAGQLTRIQSPPALASGTAQVVQFAYNTNGDVLSMTDGGGKVTAYSYDANGNLLQERDPAGNTIDRTYGSKNELLTETHYLVPDPDGAGSGTASSPITTRYAYNSANHLRFTVSAEGNVTEYQYNAYGQQISAIVYPANSYNISGLASNVSIPEATLAGWVASIADRSTMRRTDTTYDFRGNIATITSYSAATSAGVGLLTANYSRMTYIYDQFGNLLKRQSNSSPASETFVYDGLGRLTASSDLSGALTRILFLDSVQQTVTTYASGLTQTSVYNRAGELMSQTSSNTGANLVDLSGWPDDPAHVPSGTAVVPGWATSGYTAETQWAVTTGPDGNPVVAMQAGQTIVNGGAGGGSFTNWTSIDGSKAYEFTYYFKKTDFTMQSVYFGVTTSNNYVENASTGMDETNPYFTYLNPTQQQSLLNPDHWYKVVGYILPQGSADVVPGSLGGVYDMTTGQKIANTTTFRWDSARSSDKIFSRFFDYYSEPELGLTTYFYKPEIREVSDNNLVDLTGWPSDVAHVPSGPAVLPGSLPSPYPTETQWTVTTGPTGGQVVAMQAGQTDTSTDFGGGTHTSGITIDATKTYEFTYYFKKTDLTKQSVYFGIPYRDPALVENASTGADTVNPYFVWLTPGQQQPLLNPDHWYKVVGYVLPVGSANVAAGSLGGVYDMTTGQKIANATIFRWNDTRVDDQVYSRFFDFYDQTLGGLTTYFYKPGIRQVGNDILAPDPLTARTYYSYDKNGRLRMTTDPSGRRNYYLYDNAGRKVADIAGDGALVEYRYDMADRLVATIGYANRLSAAQIATLVDPSGDPANVTLAGVRPASSATDSWEWRIYDAADRLIETIDGTGSATVYSYDGDSRTASTTSYANAISAATIASFKTTSTENLWADPTDGTLWRPSWLSVSPAPAIDSGNAYKFTVTQDGQLGQFSNGASVSTGDTVTASISIRADGNVDLHYFGLYGSLSGWGNAATSTARIVSGPGVLTQYSGGLWKIIGISTTDTTRIEVTRTYTAADAMSARFYVHQTSSTTSVAGDSVIAASPSITRTSSATIPTSLILPTANTATDRLTRNFYDNDGLLIGTLDGAGGLSQFFYDEAGQKIRQIGYATAAAPALRATGTFAQLLTSVGTSASDRRTDYVYDGLGLLRYAIDANARPTEYAYNADGRLLHTTEYAGSIAVTDTYTLGYVQAQITSTGLATNPANRITRSVYDAAGRLAFGVDALGYVTAYGYDIVGNIVKQTRFATAYATTVDPSMATMQNWAASHAADAGNRVTRAFYDVLGRTIYDVDAEGFVTEHRYDAAGRATADTRYPARYTVTDSISLQGLAALIGSPPAGAATTLYAYDAGGRLTDTTNGEGAVTHFVHDALGQVTDMTVAYGTADAATTHHAFDAAGRVTSETRGYGQPEATTTSFTYDAVGNVLTQVDGLGYTTTYGYDNRGKVLTVTSPLDASNNAVTTNSYDRFGDLLTTTDPRGGVSYFFHDKLGRLTLQIDPQGFATGTVYTVWNDIASVTRYATPITSTITPGTPPTIPLNGTEDATTSFQYDKLGQVTKTTDAMTVSETYTLNAFGDRISVTNKLGGTITNIYDRRGLLLSETLPAKSTNSAGTVLATSITNTFDYDARGNRTKMVEASGLAEQRTTLYSYDKLDRLTETKGNAVNILNFDLVTITNNFVPTEKRKYDLRGNLVEIQGSGGERTLFYYDDLGNKIAQIDAAGALSTWTYDKNGNALSAMAYTYAVALPATPGGTPPPPVNSGYFRLKNFTYDRANRLLTTMVVTPRGGYWNGTAYVLVTGDATSTNYYDKAGNLVQQTDANGNTSFSCPPSAPMAQI